MSVAPSPNIAPARRDNMELALLILMLAVFGAAALQSATGIGFGVIAGPMLLIYMNDGSAIQVSIVLNLLIASLLTPALWNKSDKPVLRYLVTGLAIGSPLGLLIFLSIDIQLLKLGAGIAVVLTLFLTLHAARPASRPEAVGAGRIGHRVAGTVAGIMGVCLAMPGPVPAAWLAAKGFGKESIRATILAMFVVSYTIALVLQATMAEISPDVLRQAGLLVPATVLGVLCGHFFGRRISDRSYRPILVTVLALTAVVLFSSLA